MRIGIVDIDTSHPQNWIPIERELGHEVVGLYDAGDVHPPEYVRDFAARHQVPRVYDELEDMVADVDCAILHGCDWDRHIDRAAPFVDAGKAVLIDKPVIGNLADAQQLLDWAAAGRRITGGSSLRYAAEVQAYLAEPVEARGRVHSAFAGCGTDEFNYGIHAYSLISALLGPGLDSVRYLGTSGLKHLQLRWQDGRLGTLAIGSGAWLPFHVTAVTDKGVRQMICDTKTLYRGLLQAVLPYLAGQTDEPPYAMAQLLEPELAALAARQSWLRSGAEVFLSDLSLDDEGYDGEVFAWGYRRAKYP